MSSLCPQDRTPLPSTSHEFVQRVAARSEPVPTEDPDPVGTRSEDGLTPLESTLIKMLASDSKPLTRTLSSLDATLIRNIGGGPVMVN